MKNLFLLFILSLISHLTFAQTKDLVSEAEERKEVIGNVTDPNIEKINDRDWGVYGSYSYLDLFLPGKIGIVGTYQKQNRTYELSYEQASYNFKILDVDLGSITDRRIVLATRSFGSGSFNWTYGIYYNQVSIKLGNTYTDLVDSGNSIGVDNLGPMWGFGNRWNLDNGLSIGVDWFKIFYPLLQISSDTDWLDNADDSSKKDNIKKVWDFVSTIPTFSILHLQIGYRF